MEVGLEDVQQQDDEICATDNREHFSPPAATLGCSLYQPWKIKDLDLEFVQDSDQAVADMTGYRVLSHRFDFFGICPECQKRGE